MDDLDLSALPPTRSNLIELMRREREPIEAMIAPLSEEQLTAKGPEGWSVKDHLAHLVAWERGIVALLKGEDRVAAMGVDQATWSAGMDAANDALVEAWRAVPAVEVLADFRASRHAMIAAIGGLPNDAALLLPYAAYDPEALDMTDPVLGWIIGNTCGHDQMHGPWIAAVLESGPRLG